MRHDLRYSLDRRPSRKTSCVQNSTYVSSRRAKNSQELFVYFLFRFHAHIISRYISKISIVEHILIIAGKYNYWMTGNSRLFLLYKLYKVYLYIYNTLYI